MTEAKRGYWDVAACRWVGAEATYVLPPAVSRGPGTTDEAGATVPTPRGEAPASSSAAGAAPAATGG